MRLLILFLGAMDDEFLENEIVYRVACPFLWDSRDCIYRSDAGLYRRKAKNSNTLYSDVSLVCNCNAQHDVS